jgi:hypothetical protein
VPENVELVILSEQGLASFLGEDMMADLCEVLDSRSNAEKQSNLGQQLIQMASVHAMLSSSHAEESLMRGIFPDTAMKTLLQNECSFRVCNTIPDCTSPFTRNGIYSALFPFGFSGSAHRTLQQVPAPPAPKITGIRVRYQTTEGPEEETFAHKQGTLLYISVFVSLPLCMTCSFFFSFFHPKATV